jgi:hypothetical protein
MALTMSKLDDLIERLLLGFAARASGRSIVAVAVLLYGGSGDHPMTTPLLPAQLASDVPAWTQSVSAFLAEKERLSGSRRTVEGYARMLWPFLLRVGSPDLVTPGHVLAWAYGMGLSGRKPSSATIGARIACLSQISLTLNTYSHVIPALGRAAADQMDALLGPRSSDIATG